MAEDITIDSLEEFPQTEDENTYEVEALISEGESESIPDVVVVTSDISDTSSETTDQTDTTNETIITPDDSIVDFGVVPEEPDNTENQKFPIKKRTTSYIQINTLNDYSADALEPYMTDSEYKVYAIFNDDTEREVTWDEVYDPTNTSSPFNMLDVARIAYANGQHYWNNDNGVHITDDTLEAWATEWAKANHGTLATPTEQKPWHNILMNSVGIILRTGTKFLSSWSKSGVAFYDGTGNSASNVIASYGSNGAQIGKSSEKHAVIDSSGLTVYDENGDIAPVVAHLDGSYINDSTITGSKFVDGTITGSKIDSSTITNSHLVNGTIEAAKIKDGTITGAKIANGTIEAVDIKNSTITGAKIAATTIDNSNIKNGTITGAKISEGTIENTNIKDGTITGAKIQGSTLTDIPYAEIDELKAKNISSTDIQSATGYIGSLEAGSVSASDIIADHAEIDALDTNYAQINMANVNNAWIENGVVKNGAIKNGMIESVTASKLTAGTINADTVNITNLKAENIKVSKINGVTVTGKSVKDALEQHEDDISDLDSKIDDAIEDLNDRIDAQIETWTTDTIPLLSNYPASSWNTNDLKAEHVGDICYVVNAVSDADGYTYRFAYDNATSSYKWVLIKDNQVTAALGRISDLETFESNTSTWIDETDEGLTTIRENHTALSGRVDKTLISTTQLWFTKANTTAPNAPSAHVTVNNPATANAWNIAVPTYNVSYPNYYYCYEWQYADNTYGWSAVTRDIATGEMQATSRSAQNTANSAIKSSIQLWYTKANDTAPSKPTKTSDVVSNAATANKWNTLVPTYNNSYPYYFYCWQYQKADNTYVWSDVVYDRATTENQANSRNAQATLANKVDSSTFSELVETVDEHSNTITSLSTVSETLIKESIEYIVGTQTAVTGSWTGVTREEALYNGKTIAYRLPYAGSGNASLNLTLAGGGTTGAKAVYINNTRVTTHYPANSVITLTYNGTDWRASAYWDGNTYDRTRYSVYIKIVTAATRTWQMFVGNNDGYRRLVAGISYDLSYPLLVFSDTPAAGETKNTGYLCVSGYIYNIYVGTTVQSAAVNKLVYLKGTVNGTIFTVASSNFLTCAVPTTEDNFFYIPLGVITVVDSTNTTGYFQTNDQLWAYIDGKFQQANPMVKTTNTVVNEVKQTADTNTASIRGLTTITDNLSLFNNGHPDY